MAPVSMIAIDLAKNVFHLHAVSSDGGMIFRKKLSRGQVLDFIAGQPRCCGAMRPARRHIGGADSSRKWDIRSGLSPRLT